MADAFLQYGGEKMSDVTSYTAAGNMPWKLLQCNDAVINNKIIPYHIQLIPTNRCNGNCSWCSCSAVDRTIELDIEEIINILEYFTKLGTKAVTITGGGEPTIHPFISNVIHHAHAMGLSCGIVTNGLLWGKENYNLEDLTKKLTWTRMSIIDTVGKYDTKRVTNLCKNLSETGIGISFTVPEDVNVDTAMEICKMADGIPNLTHIRFVQDLLSLDIKSMLLVQDACKGISDKAIFQWRTTYTNGAKGCYIAKLKPLIDATGYIYPCCGVQYATKETRKLPEQFKMCYWKDFHKTGIFDGQICDVCYYNDYNNLLRGLVKPLKHGEFL